MINQYLTEIQKKFGTQTMQNNRHFIPGTIQSPYVYHHSYLYDWVLWLVYFG